MRKMLLLMLVGVQLLLVISVGAQDACAGLVPTRLATGVTARVRFDDGVGVVLRSAPSIDETRSEVIETLPEGVIFTAIGEAPQCQDGRLWWLVRLPDGREGYVSEGGVSVEGYFIEPWEVGALVYMPAEAVQPAQNSNSLNVYFVNTRGDIQARTPLLIPPQNTPSTVATRWQQPEVALASTVAADRAANCPSLLPSELNGVPALDPVTFEDVPSAVFPNPDGTALLAQRDYLINLPDCTGKAELYGTSTFSLITGGGEQVIFPFSQHGDPPPSQFCQPQAGNSLEYLTYINEVAWAQDGKSVAIGVRYLRNSASFPCAFYHVFIVNVTTLEVIYAGEGRRIGWGQGGWRLRYLRHERTDPNAVGKERLFSVLSDGTDTIEVFLPGGATWLPGALDLSAWGLPWTENGDKVLACNGRVYSCGETLTFRIIDSGFEDVAIIAPEAAQLGSTLASVQFVAGDSQLLWLSTDGKLFLQPIKGATAGRWIEAAVELQGDAPIVQVIPLPTGVGAVLILSDGRHFYLDVLANTVRPLTGF